ncbi:MAG: hypothetical protein M0P71_02055 [Melioribacteraceae bacterium]|nr:hypothetical protein [Melioribacteraceae bacterium]
MKKYIAMIIVLGAMVASPLSAQNKGFGMGLMLGEPTGLSAKAWTSPTNAVDFGLGVGLGGDRIKYKGVYNDGSRVHFHMDYLWHSFRAINASGRVPLYYGIGARFNSGGGYESSLGIRGVVGIEWFPQDSPLDIFFEVVPVFQITPLTGLGFDAAVGIRYFFQ